MTWTHLGAMAAAFMACGGFGEFWRQVKESYRNENMKRSKQKSA